MGWVALLACGLLLLMALLWGLFGSVSVKTAGRGVLIGPGGIKDVVALTAGQVAAIHFDAGDTVEAGWVVASVVEPNQPAPTGVVCPYAGRVLEIKAVEGGLVERGSPILSLEVAAVGPLEAVVYVPAAEGGNIRPGMRVQISPTAANREAFGFMLGRVGSVGDFPASRRGMLRRLGSEELVDALSSGDASIEVRVTLNRDPQTASGYAWSSVQGPPMQIDGGTLCTAWIEISTQKPLSLVLPLFE
jgi:NHLM bacteriocin system secretion protein